MTAQEIFDLYRSTQGTILLDKKRLVFDVETLDTSPRASVVSAAFVGLGMASKEYNLINSNVQYGQVTPVQTPFFYSAWGTHARRVAEKGLATKSVDTLRWWGELPAEAQAALWDDNKEWEQDAITISKALSEVDEVWTYHTHFDQPIWEHWCQLHGLPPGAHYRKFKDLATIFDDYPQVERIRPVVAHHALFDCLSMASQLEQCLILREYFSKYNKDLS